jgi:hypothetical protein
MRLMATAFAVAAAFAVFAVSAAEAAPRKKTVAQRSVANGSTVFTSRDETGRTRTRIIVQKRSYLDGGTEVMPGTYMPANAMTLPGQRPTDGLGNNVIINPRGPIPDPFFLPGKNNPWHGFWN